MVHLDNNLLIVILFLVLMYVLWVVVLYLTVRIERPNAERLRKLAYALMQSAQKWQQILQDSQNFFFHPDHVEEPPYAEPLDRGRKAVNEAAELATSCVARAEAYSQFHVRRYPFLAIAMIVPAFFELLGWVRLSLGIRSVSNDLHRVNQTWKALTAIDSEISNLAGWMKRAMEDQRNRIGDLEVRRQRMVTADHPLTMEGVSLSGALTSAEMVQTRLLQGDDPPRLNVAGAYQWYREINAILNEVEQKLHLTPTPALDAQYAMRVVQRQYTRLHQSLLAETHANGPCPTIEKRAQGIEKSLADINRLLKARRYPAAEQKARALPVAIQALHSDLDQVQVWREHAIKARDDAHTTQAECEKILAQEQQSCEMDLSEPKVREMRSQVLSLDRICISDDIGVLINANDIKRDYDANLVAWTTLKTQFEASIRTLEELKTDVSQDNVMAARQCATDLANRLSASHAEYQRDFKPEMLITLRNSLDSEWQLANLQVKQLKESQLAVQCTALKRPATKQKELLEYCNKVETVLADRDAEQKRAQDDIGEIDRMLQECHGMAGKWDSAALDTVAGFQEQREMLYQAIHPQPPNRPFYATLLGDTSKLLAQMKEFAWQYQHGARDSAGDLAALSQAVDAALNELRDLRNDPKYDLSIDAQSTAPLSEWLSVVKAQENDPPLREMNKHLDEGRKLLNEAHTRTDRVRQDLASYEKKLSEVEGELASMRDHLDRAEQQGLGRHTDDVTPVDRIRPIRTVLDDGGARLTQLKLPATRYTLQSGHAELDSIRTMVNYAGKMIDLL